MIVIDNRIGKDSPREEDNYQQGEEVFYQESGNVLRVNVLANNSNNERIRYELMLTRVMQGSAPRGLEVGDSFPCEKKRDVVVGSWQLCNELGL